MGRIAVQHTSVVSSVPGLSHAESLGCGGMRLRRGFTLIELVAASVILFVLIFGLASMFAQGVTGFKQAQLLTMAQNLAEFQAEDFKNLATSVLNELVEHTYSDINYPYSSRPSQVSGDTSCGTPLSDGHGNIIQFDDGYCWAYDSGKLQTDFRVDGVMQIGTHTIVPGQSAADALPIIPTSAEVLLGDNIVVQVYGDDPDPTVGLRYLYDYDKPGWYYLWTDAGGIVHRTDVTLTDPAKTFVYYCITLEKEAFPLFSREIRIVRYDVDTPTGADVWHWTSADLAHHPSVDPAQRVFRGDTRTKFDYEITVWYKQNGVDRVLFQSSGTIAAPFVAVGSCRRVS